MEHKVTCNSFELAQIVKAILEANGFVSTGAGTNLISGDRDLWFRRDPLSIVSVDPIVVNTPFSAIDQPSRSFRDN